MFLTTIPLSEKEKQDYLIFKSKTMNLELFKVALRKQAIYIADAQINMEAHQLHSTTANLVANAKDLGYAFSEDLLRAINLCTPPVKKDILKGLEHIKGVNKNWTPLVKGWDIPTGESILDHAITLLHNLVGSKRGTTLTCGHLIPRNTFPLERYNGCPFCGTPFEFDEKIFKGQSSKLKILELWTDADIQQHYIDLLTSKTALDATQRESLNALLATNILPEGIEIGMKETLMMVIAKLVDENRANEASPLFKSPSDILRYLWYRHTGFLQIIEPKTLVKRIGKNNQHLFKPIDQSAQARIFSKEKLKLKYTRTQCRIVAQWMNDLPLAVEKSCEIMHPKRNMWVRFIRALRLVEYSKKKGFKNLATLLKVFHGETYEVTEGRINHFRLKYDAEKTFAILEKRPGLFARSLFSNILWFGPEITLKHFHEVADKVPARLLLTLNMYATYYFDKTAMRSVKPLGGIQKKIGTNPLLRLFTAKELEGIQTQLEDFCMNIMKDRFAKMENENNTIYIDEQLFKIPLSIGDRSETVQDIPSALMGTRFPLEGSKVRLFMQWGNGLPAQHLDMDLSCSIAFPDKIERCSYSKLTATGCKHSGDIIKIPNKVGTAEYIELEVDELSKAGAQYVSFTCNAYSKGSISPNLVVGWMNSQYPMKISKKSGVAYDPSCVQHQVRITQGLSKGLVFGVLDIAAKEIVWLEMSFGGQVVQGLNVKGVKALLNKLDSKFTLGNLLKLKAEAQDLQIENSTEADEVYDTKWAMNTAAVTQLLLD